MNNLRRFLSPILLLLTFTVRALGGSVVINEVIYHSPTENLHECYFELYNLDTHSVNLSPGGYLIVASDATVFTNKYPRVTNFVAGRSGAMSTHLRFEDASGASVNDVNFSNDGDWAARDLTTNYNSFGYYDWEWSALHDGSGSSLELMNPYPPNSYGHNWGSGTIFGGTPGAPNSIARTNIAPIITSVAHSPIIPQATDPSYHQRPPHR